MIPSLLSVVPKFLSRREVNTLLKECSDWREIISTAAAIKKVSEESLINIVAAMLKMQSISKLAPFDAAAVPFSLHTLRTNGCAPIMKSEQIVAFAAVDPARVKNVWDQYFENDIFLASWKCIEAVLDESENIYNNSRCNDDVLLYNILELLIEELASFRESRTFLSFPEGEIVYEFQTDRGCKAMGSIGAQVRERLLEFIERFSHSKEKLLLGEKLEISVSISLVDEREKRFLLSWEKVSTRSEHATDVSRADMLRIPCSYPHILIVEDNKTFAEVLRQFFTKKGFGVTLAFGGEEATVLIENKEQKFDCVISDLHMPKLNGFDVLSTLRSSPSRRDLPFVFLTSDNQVENQLAAFEKGADGYLTKQQDPRIIHAYVSRLIARQDLTGQR